VTLVKNFHENYVTEEGSIS